MWKRTIGFGVVVVGLGFAGCGGSTDDGAPPAGGTVIPLDEIPDKFVAMQCGAIETCMGDTFALFAPGMDCATRFGREFEDGEWPNMQKAIDEGTVIYHGDKVQACLDAYTALGCDIFVSRAPAVCEEALEGTVDEGGDCTLNSECKGQLFCKAGSACPGTCSALLPADSACSANDACENGLVCDETLKTCQGGGAKGAACQGDKPECAFGLLCVGASETASGTCKEYTDVFSGELGAVCDLVNTEWCKPGLSCVVESWTAEGAQSVCKAAAASGAACGIGVPNQCPADEYCNADVANGHFEGTCTKLPTDGQPCTGGDGLPLCAPYHVCDSTKTCRELERLDAACGEKIECYSGYCESGTCTATNACTK